LALLSPVARSVGGNKKKGAPRQAAAMASALSSSFLCVQPMGFYIGETRNSDDSLFF
jgi:hypothetical protein